MYQFARATVRKYHKEKFGHTGRYTGRTPCEDEGRGGDDTSISQGTPEISSKPTTRSQGES